MYAVGSVNQNEVAINGQYQTALDALTLKRQGEVLIVNDQTLQPQESYTGFSWRFSLNPWLLITARVNVKNEGINQTGSEDSSNALLVSGGVYEGWLPSPVGIIALIIGVLFMWRGNQERKKAERTIK